MTSPLTPSSLRVEPRHLAVGGEFMASFAVVGYPREVYAGWLQPLLAYPGRVDVSLHVEPIDPVTAADRLKRQLGKLEAGRRHTAEKGRLADPAVEVAAEDAHDLSARVARRVSKLFRLGLYLTVHAPSREALADEVAAVRSLAASLLLNAQPTSYRSLQGWVACLPVGLDTLRMRRTFDTDALAAAFPFTSADLPNPDPTRTSTPGGVLYGFNMGSSGLVHWDRFAADNYNAVILARSGAGKSYLAKLETLRWLYAGVESAIIDPEDEYATLCHAVGGTYLHLGGGVRINPFDLPIVVLPDGRRTAPPDALNRRALFLQTVIEVLLGGEQSAQQRAVLDTAILATYQRAGITADARTWSRPAPLLKDLAAVLSASKDEVARELGARLHPFVAGAFAELFAGPTSVQPDGHLVVFSLRDLPDELRPIGLLLALDAVWRRVSTPVNRRPRLVLVDEAWLLMQHPAGARFLYRLANSARKRWVGLTVITPNIVDLTQSELGRAIIANSTTQILLRQSPQAVDEVVVLFGLSEGERQHLLAADRGQGLLIAGSNRVAFQALASPREDTLITTDPAQLAAMHNGHDPTADSGVVVLESDDEDGYVELDLPEGRS
jgi:type IV secretory pathway VirB4 component